MLLKEQAAHANVSPQNVYKLFTSSVQHKLTISARTTPIIVYLLRKCEITINNELLPNLLENPAYNQIYRSIFSLPIREAGLKILNPEDLYMENERSVELSNPLSLCLPEVELKL